MDRSSRESQPSWFLSHGAPHQLLMEDDYSAALHGLAHRLPSRPKAIVVVSAHGTSAGDSVQVSADARPEIQYDFRGFQPEMYQMQYPCPGSPELAAQIAQRLSNAEVSVDLVTGTRLDHGVWVPLKMIFPDASIPVVQILMPSYVAHASQMADVNEDVDTTHGQHAALFLKVGKALAELRREGVLVIGSGGAVHNLRLLQWADKGSRPPQWAVEFEAWLRANLEARDVGVIAQFRDEAPHAETAHPTVEHFTPLLFAIGATLPGDTLDWIYEGYQYGALSLLCVGFTQPGAASGSNLPN